MPSLSATLITAFLAGLRLASAQDDLFTVNCQPLSQQRSDPIISPGVPSGHVHAISGGTAFNRTMSPSEATGARNTTCDKILDRSNYWVPQLYHTRSDGKFELVTYQGNAVYYFKRACDYVAGKTACAANDYPRAFPAGLRMVAGNPTLRTYNASDIRQRAISHMCLTNTDSVMYAGLPSQNCLRLRSQVTFPPCWDGQHLDTDDHVSHMAYPAIGDYNGGVCPSSHPIALIQIFYEYFFDTSVYSDHKFVYSMGDATGYGYHGDFINGWTDLTRLGNALKTCTGSQGVNDPNCSLNVNGKGAGTASSQTPQVPAPYEEEIGLHGPIAKLPGNNPVTGTPPSRKRSRVYRNVN